MKYIYSTCPCGQIKGIGAEDYRLFKGIRYARANRWEAPEEVTGWEGVYDATTPGALCPQYDAYITGRPPVKQFYYDETVEKEGASYSEDCLYLNIWTPLDAQKAPVLMYIHGGSYETGAGSKVSFNGMNYCRRGVIVVTINYRLNAFSSAVGDGIKGNFGLRDQVCALQWIRHNIAAFGGDPEKVTIMGESAGAMSVQNLIFTPLAKGLFRGAVMLSGAGINGIRTGDIYLALCAVAFAVQITLIDRYAADLEPIALNCIQALTCSILSFCVVPFTETITLSGVLEGWFPLCYAGVLSMGIAYSLQIMGQQKLESTKASLIMSLESVFAAIAGALLLHERMTTMELAGCALVFAGVLISQIPSKKTK